MDEKINLHPDRLADDLYIMGTYSTSPVMGKQIVIYYGSFTKTMPYADEEALRLKIRDTLRHEFRHHMETRAGFFGKGTLIDEDKREMSRYFLMHAKREEAARQAEDERAAEAAAHIEADACETKEEPKESGEYKVTENTSSKYETDKADKDKEAAPAYKTEGSASISVVIPVNERGSERVPDDSSVSKQEILPAGFSGGGRSVTAAVEK